MVGARRIELRFDFIFATFTDLRGDVRINHHGFAQCDKFRPAGFIGGQNLVGGKQAKTPIGGEGIGDLSQAVKLKLVSMEMVGEDILIDYEIIPHL